MRVLRALDPSGGRILLALVVALVLVPNASGYEVPSRLNEVARVYSLGVGEVRCPSRAEWDEDWASSLAWAYTNIREDYIVLSPVVCTGALGVGSADVPLWQQALGALILTHEAFHLRHWRFRRHEGKGGVPGPRELQGRHAATGSDGRTSRGSLPLRAGVARLQSQALPTIQGSDVRDPALGSADDDRMTGRHGDRHAERAQPRASCDQTQRNGQSARRSRAAEGWVSTVRRLAWTCRAPVGRQ